MTIRALIVDDEPLARRRIRDLLELENGAAAAAGPARSGDAAAGTGAVSSGARVVVAGECATGREAVASIRSLKPDLVFLDVQMPGLSGFDVIEAVGSLRMPAVIFVTAHDEHAVRAFEVSALDYLLKPFDEARFAAALRRARARIAVGGAGLPDRILVSDSGRVIFLDLAEIDWVEAMGNYVRLHAGGRAHALRETLSRMEARLAGSGFARIHRSTLVNIERIREVVAGPHADRTVILRDGVRLALSRRYRARIQARLGRGARSAPGS